MKPLTSLASLLACLLLLPAPASAQMNYQGRLTDASGNPLVDGQYHLEFRIFSVSKGTDAVPDIYQPAPCKDGWVELTTDLKAGERVKLITEKNGASIEEVLEVKANKFRTGFKHEGVDRVFVYGREVNDFRSVDYDAIAMLNVSATQELHRQLQQKDAKIAGLEKRLAALETAVTTLAGTAPKTDGRAVIHVRPRAAGR